MTDYCVNLSTLILKHHLAICILLGPQAHGIITMLCPSNLNMQLLLAQQLHSRDILYANATVWVCGPTEESIISTQGTEPVTNLATILAY